MIPVQTTLFTLRKAMGAIASALRINLGANIVPVIEATDVLEADGRNVHVRRGHNLYARVAIVTGAVGGQAQARLYNPTDSGRLVRLLALAAYNNSGVAVRFDLEINPPIGTRAGTLDGNLHSLNGQQRVPPGPSVSKAELYFDTDAYAPSNRIMSRGCAANGMADFPLPLPIELEPGMDVQIVTTALNTNCSYGFLIRELDLNP